MKIVIIDYGIGNIKSIANAVKKFKIEPVVSNEKDVILSADGVILPGVGAYTSAMQNLEKLFLVDVIKEFAKTSRPLLGICLGMQLLLQESDEFEPTKGLGLIEGKVEKFEGVRKLPHISWNEVRKDNIEWENSIFEGVKNSEDFYFVHSYISKPNTKYILATTKYEDVKFCSAVKKGNIYGCQFHPEKSSINGLKVIENFIKICKEYENASCC